MSETDYIKAREHLLEAISRDARDTVNFTGRSRISTSVMTALNRVPRHKFMPPGDEPFAYLNRPQSIGYGQTISQPFIVAIMTDFLNLQAGDRVLEIGCGCGYQSAVLAEIAQQVYSLEIIETLADTARKRLSRLGYDNIHIRHGDGFEGLPEEAPFDAIIVTAAPKTIPGSLIKQLDVGGRIVIPVGPPSQTQILKFGMKGHDGKMVYTSTLPVAFVPMVKS